jgi:hypothetical protein
MIQILTRRLTNQVALSRHPLEPISELAVGRCGRGMIRGHDRPGSQARPRRAVGDRGAAAPAATPKPSRRPTAQRARPQLSGRDHLRDPRLHPLGAAARRRAWRGSYATCWRRFSEWAAAGVFETLHLVLLDRLGEQGMVDWSRLLVDSASLRAKRGGPRRRKPGRPRQAGEQAPSGHRREGTAVGDAGQRRQRQRLRAV